MFNTRTRCLGCFSYTFFFFFFLVKMNEIDSVGKAGRQKRERCVCIHSQLKRTFITEQAGPVNVFSLHGPIYPTLVSKRSAMSPVKKRHSRGKSPYLPRFPPAPPRHACIQTARRERPGRKGGIVFAINSSRE